MKNYFIASSIILTTTFAAGFILPNERFTIALNKIKSIQVMLEKDRSSARQNKDIILFDCINDASHQVYAAIKLIEDRYANSSNHDADVAEEILRRVLSIQSQASLCHGNTLVFTQRAASVSTSIDSTIAEVSPDVLTSQIAIESPNCASCFK
jgi:hypothetical protein